MEDDKNNATVSKEQPSPNQNEPEAAEQVQQIAVEVNVIAETVPTGSDVH